ncbi:MULTISPECIES: DUF6625 family protein [Pseudomonadaceae]|jgi:hypothetical protein|uniref:DUF6625 family protein n=1 Tax=Pseudomonadaceae TaxID=135621 RepID=UPI0005CB5B8D|nr:MULTISPECIES: DUF6625 family protein [Pseudomonas]MBO2925860.1 hypothetical protein [Pseudomonas otitidis]
MPSICFVIPYFGSWPFWFPLFLRSCALNPDIDWLLYSDCGVPDDLPGNVSIEEISYEDYCLLVSQRLQIKFMPRNPYKLCDIKEALGFVHADRLEEYDFWGFGDIDVIYGRLRKYFNVERLSRYELLSTHSRRISGHLCLLRNNTRMREAFRRIPKWRDLFADEEHHALDEGAFSRIFLWRKNLPAPLFRLVGKFNPMHRCSEFKEAYSTPNAGRTWTNGTYNFPKEWYWRNGLLTNDLDGDREFPYLHFFGWKRDAWIKIERPDADRVVALSHQPEWMISDAGFSELSEV